MRFMMLMIPKGYDKAEPGTMPDAKAGRGDDEVQRSPAKSRRAARARWTASAVRGRPGFVGDLHTRLDLGAFLRWSSVNSTHSTYARARVIAEFAASRPASISPSTAEAESKPEEE